MCRATLDPLSALHAHSPHPATRSHGSTFELSLVLRIGFRKRQWWQWPIAILGTHPQKIHQHPSPEWDWQSRFNRISSPRKTRKHAGISSKKKNGNMDKYDVSSFQSSSEPTPTSSTYLTKPPYPTHALGRVNLVTKCLPLRSHVNFPLTK